MRYMFSIPHREDWVYINLVHCKGQGVTKRCHLSLLTNRVLVYESKCGRGGELQGLSKLVQLCTSRDMEPK
jgi:hypothetical protein